MAQSITRPVGEEQSQDKNLEVLTPSVWPRNNGKNLDFVVCSWIK